MFDRIPFPVRLANLFGQIRDDLGRVGQVGKSSLDFKKHMRQVTQGWKISATALGSAGIAIALSWTGVLQSTEWTVLDSFFGMRTQEAPDARVVVVTIGESDISNVGTYPIPDQVLVKALQTLKNQKPRAIGLDLYRDLPVDPGYRSLTKFFQETVNLIGVQKEFGKQKVPPPPMLASLNRVAIADLVEDADGKIRRDLLAARAENGELYFGLGSRLALLYLEAQGQELKAISATGYQLGRATIYPFQSNEGGYIRAEDQGYQAILNYRGSSDRFYTVSLTDVLTGKLPSTFAKDKVVLMGPIADSLGVGFRTPYTSDKTSRVPGVYIHANSASQLISAAIDGRSLLRGVPEPWEWLWCVVWAAVGSGVSWAVLRVHQMTQKSVALLGASSLTLAGCAVVSVSFALFLNGWWISTISALLSLAIATGSYLVFNERNWQRLAYLDDLTQVANRRYFDRFLLRQAHLKGNLSLIMCDVDYFKQYNDTYGHLAGDHCLRQVAAALQQAVRRTDLVARYGGEEFVIVLPNADAKAAIKVAKRVLKNVRSLELLHQASEVSEFVTLSCGVVTTTITTRWRYDDRIPLQLVGKADEFLYVAKERGRNQYAIAPEEESQVFS